MKRRPFWSCAAIIAVCFLYAGSAYMSQSFRLMAFYSQRTVDLITSVFCYLLQAAGIGAFSFGLRRCPDRILRPRPFVVLLLTGAVFMAAAQLSNSSWAVLASSLFFNLHIGLYAGYYITLLGKCVPPDSAGLCFGAAYAAGSVGTYLLSLAQNGAFLASGEITAIYLLLVSLAIGLVFFSADLIEPAPAAPAGGRTDKVRYLLPFVAVMTVIFSVGSGLFYSSPVATSVNWSLIRAFYAVGLVLAGVVLDKKRRFGEILLLASLTYPLIMSTLVDDGVAGFAALSFSYIFRAFLTIYYVVVFAEFGFAQPKLLPLAPVGLMISRASEALVSWLLLSADIPDVCQLIFSAACFIPLLALFFRLQSRETPAPPVSEAKRLALFSEKYALTAREAEMLKCLAANMSDGEIAAALHISRNTVRFHISNLMKKTSAASRVEVTRLLDKF